jgi:two-component system, cell cycle sensor histidine kinase and response regulator CckA
MKDDLKPREQLLEELISLRRQVSQMKKVEFPSPCDEKEELRESAELFRGIFEHMAAACCIDEIIYENGKPVDYRVLDINRSFERIIGVSRSQAVGALASQLYGITKPPFFDIYVKVAETGEPAFFEGFFPPIGKHLDVSASCPARGRFSTVFTDITERKKMEEALQAEKDRFSKIVETAPGVICSFHQRPDGSGFFPYASPALRDVFGLRPEDLAKDASCMQVSIHPDDVKHIQETIAESARTLSPWRDEFRYRHPKKGEIWVGSHFMPERRADGSIIWHGILIDITERKQAEEERERLMVQLNQAQKMESIGRLAGGVAHDFNNMLGVILGNVEMAINRTGPSQPIYADLEEISKAAHRSTELTRQLLAFARKQIVAPSVLDLNEVLSGMLKMLHRLIGENINLNWRPNNDLWPVRMDPSQIDQILANLCINARDAIAGAGSVNIETSNVTLDKAYCAEHAGLAPGQYVLLTVNDDGCGMAPETLNNLFEPFFTTKGMGKGTGLGLSTVYGIVKQNNGFIYAYSKPEHGTTFKIYLPRYAAMVERSQKEGTAAPVTRGRETILLAEDEPEILRLITVILERLGYTVLAACSPGEVIRLAKEHTGEIQLLMTDVIMPEMNGRELAQNVVSLYPQVKCLFMSGYTADIIAHHGVLDEGVYFIQKPFSMSDLAVKVREALNTD